LEAKLETKLTALEEKRPDALEMAKEKDEEREEETSKQVNSLALSTYFFDTYLYFFYQYQPNNNSRKSEKP
jgi:hypothetical protein